MNYKGNNKLIKNSLIFVFCFVFFIFSILPKKNNEMSKDGKLIPNPHEISKTDSLRVGHSVLEKPLNPFFDGATSISTVSKLINRSIFTKGKNNEIISDIAKEYWYGDDGKSISVILRDDVRFSNGKKLNAKHVFNTYRVLADPSYGGKYSYFVDNLKGYYRYKTGESSDFSGVEVGGENFVVFHFNIADFSNTNALMFPILDIEDEDFSYNDVSSISSRVFTNGAGFYNVKEYDNSKVKLELKENFKSEIGIWKIDINFYNYMDAMKRYSSGSLDMLYNYHKNEIFSSLLTERLREFSYIIEHQSNIYKYLGFNSESKIFSQKEFRRALRDSINLESLLDEFQKGIYQYPLTGVYENSWFNPSMEIKKGNTLRELLNRKYKNRDGYFVNEFGKEIEITLIVHENDQFYQLIDENLKKVIEDNGLKLKVQLLSSKDMYDALRGEKHFDIFISQRNMAQIPSSKEEEKYFGEETYTITSQIDKFIIYLQSIIENKKQDNQIKELIESWKKFFEENTPYIVLATEVKTTVVNNRIEGLYLNEFIGLDNIENLKKIHLR